MIDAKKTKAQLISELESMRERERMRLSAGELEGESDRWPRLLADAVPVSICYIDRDERYRFNNRTMCSWIGQDAAHLQGKKVGEVMPPEDYRTIRPHIQRVLAGERHEYELEITFPDGIARKLQAVYIPDIDAQGRVLGFSSLVEDATERLRTEEELRDSRRLLRTVFDAHPQRLSLRDKNKNLLMVNKAAAALRGLSPEEYIRLPERYPSLQNADVEMIEAVNDRVLREGKTLESEREVVWADGRKGWNHSIKVPFRDSEGNIEGVITLIEDVTERKRAEQEIKDNRQLLQTVFDTIPSVLTLRGKERKLLMVNQAAASKRNLTPEEYLKLPENYPALGKEEIEIIETMDEQVLREGKHLEYDKEVTWANGEQGWHHIIKAPFRDADGNIEGVVTLMENIAGRKQSEQELQDSRRLLQTVFDTVPARITVKNKHNRMIMANKAAAVSLNVTPEEFLRLPGQYPAMKPGDAAKLRAIDEKIFREGEGVEFVRFIHWKNGKAGWFQIYRVPFKDEEGHIEGLVVVSEDITERKQAEESLKESRKLLQTVFDTIPHWLIVKDKESRYLMVNKALADTFGMEPEDFVGLETKDVILGSTEERENFMARDWEIFRTGKPASWEGVTVTLPSGKQTIRHISKMPLRNEEEEIVGLVALSEDITQRKLTEEQLLHSQKMEAIGQLTGGVAHEFNNLLQIILGYTQIALSLAGKDSRISEHLEKIVQSSERASSLTRQLLAFGRKEVYRPIHLDLHSHIESWLHLMDRVFGEKITIELVLDREPCVVFADPALVQQVLLNLCINAKDAMPKGGRLSIATRKIAADEDFTSVHSWADREEYVAIGIRDTGVGMPPEVREKVFEPFYTTKEVGQGTGLGLSTAYGIIQQHGGNILVDSQEGKGATFTVYLPAEKSKSAPIQEDAPMAGAGGNETVLAAGNEEDVLAQIASILESRGYQVRKARSGEEALQVLAESGGDIDLALLDLALPNMSGRGIYPKIKEIAPTVTVLFSIGNAADPLDTDFLSRNRVALVRKPFSPVELILAVRKVLDEGKWPPSRSMT